jgi:hypothetical protein
MRAFLFVTGLIFFLLACKKNTTEAPPDPTKSILGKWKINSYVYFKTSGGSTTKETINLSASDSYVDFHGDLTAYEKFLELDGTTYLYDTASYNLTDATLKTTNTRGIQTTNLLESWTDHSVTMHTTEQKGVKYEAWYYLTK